MDKDSEQLNLLKILHYVAGGIGCFFSCIPLIHVTIGLLMVTNTIPIKDPAGNGPPAAFGWIFVILGGSFFLIGQAISICTIVSGRYISQTKAYLFSFIIACIMCISFPFGTALGVFTIIVLSRDSVKQRYDDQKQFEA